MATSTETPNFYREADTNSLTSAMWYAWGRADATPGVHIDPFVFGEHYRDMARALRAGEATFLPSIQDCFKTWMAGS